MIKKHIIVVILTISFVISILTVGWAAPSAALGDQNVVTKSIDLLKSKGIKDDADGMLLLKRYNFYLSEIANGNGFSKYIANKTPSIYNFSAFSNVIYKDSINKIVDNTLQGKDAFAGFTGLFERAYISESDKALDSYVIYLPKKYNPSKSYPLVVFLHGFGEATYLPMNISAHANFLKACEKHEVIMVAPNGKHNVPTVITSYQDAGEKDVLQVIQLAQKAYNIDTKRIYLTGLSFGGHGTWYIGTKHSELFAAIAPISGFGTKQFADDAASRGWKLETIDVSLLKNTPAYVWHGDNDNVVSVTESRELVSRMKEFGYKVDYEELKGVGHGAADYAYDDDKVIKWFLQYSKE